MAAKQIPRQRRRQRDTGGMMSLCQLVFTWIQQAVNWSRLRPGYRIRKDSGQTFAQGGGRCVPRAGAVPFRRACRDLRQSACFRLALACAARESPGFTCNADTWSDASSSSISDGVQLHSTQAWFEAAAPFFEHPNLQIRTVHAGEIDIHQQPFAQAYT